MVSLYVLSSALQSDDSAETHTHVSPFPENQNETTKLNVRVSPIPYLSLKNTLII